MKAIIKNVVIHRPDLMKEPEVKTFGLGDAVASAANPIAKTIDYFLGTNIVGCGGCKKRQEALNKIIPDLKNPILQKDNVVDK